MAEQMITKDQVVERIAAVKQIIKDEHPAVASAKAHKEQDALVKEVLEAVANSAKDAEYAEYAAALTQAVLGIYQLEFTRWYS